MLSNKFSRGQLDEMQIQIRNKTGHQCFFLLYFLLMIDLLLAEFGVKWAEGPTRLVVIMLISFAYYLVQIVRAGAYTRAGDNPKYIYLTVGLITATAFLIAIAKKTRFFNESLDFSDSGLFRLFIFYIFFFLIVLISRSVSKQKNNSGDD